MAFERVGGVNPGAMPPWGHMGQDVVFGFAQERGDLREAFAQLIDDDAPLVAAARSEVWGK